MLQRSAAGDRFVEVNLGAEAEGCVGDMVVALGAGESEDGLIVDGEWFDPSTPLTAVPLREGSLVETARYPRPAPPPSARMLTVTGGLRAGARHALPESATLSIGRGAMNDVVIDDPSVSRRHLSLRVADPPAVIDHGSRNGVCVGELPVAGPTRVAEDATVRLGASRLKWRVEPDDVPFAVKAGLGAVGGTVPFNRPPRAAPPVDPPVLAVPPEPVDPPPPEPISWAGIVLPVVGGALVAVLLSPLFVVFAALGPVLTIGTWLERRRRARRAERADRRHLEQGLLELRSVLPSFRNSEIERMTLLHPDLGEVVRRAVAPSVRCWERRPSDPDFLQLVVGTADRRCSPPVSVAGEGSAAAPALEEIARQPPIPDTPVVVDLGAGRVVGLVGPSDVTRAIVRSLLIQAAVHHGPADLAVSIVATGDSENPAIEWEWARWLPHATDVVAGRAGGLIATGAMGIDAVLESAASDESTRTRLAVIDGADALTGRTAPGRVLLADGRVTALVIVRDGHHLPASCTTVVEVLHPAGRLRVLDPRTTDALDSVVAWGTAASSAAEAARGLARLDDPDLPLATGNLPAALGLLDLYEGEIDPDVVTRQWSDTRGTAELRVPIGADEHGPIWLDLVADGPHVLVGGTTGSGKSELLRSLVAGLALAADPDHVAIVLIDYKGGAAFDRCADLPHVAGMVTDLDDRLAERALRCLEAELRHREGRLRDESVEDMAAFRDATTGRAVDPLPRLVVVIDEFATLAADLPDFLHSLVGIAQRGRSLGVHLVLATQRPAGVVTEDIRANTSCRIALRVTDRQDSLDVIDAADAVAIPRHRPGRAVARLGPGELVAFQSALVSGHTGGRNKVQVMLDGRADRERGRSDGVGRSDERGRSDGVGRSDERGRSDGVGRSDEPGRSDGVGPTDLDRLVAAVRAADAARGGRRPRSPWPPPLPLDLGAGRIHDRARDHPATWLVDDPDRQLQHVDGWNPVDGHLLILGGPGSGRTTTLAAVALDLCRRNSADELHVQVVDLDSGSLSPLVRLPHVGSVIGPVEADRRARLFRLLDEDVAARRAGVVPPIPEVVLVIDDLAGLTRAHDPVRDPEPHDRLLRIWSDGPAVGVRVAASVGRAAEISPGLAATSGVVLMHRVTDPSDGLRFGCRIDTSMFPPGRAVRVADGLEVHVARPDGDLDATVTDISRAVAPPAAAPLAVGSLDAIIEWRALPAMAHERARRIDLVFARDDARLEPCGLTLHHGEHALVLGPARSGRTNTLAVIGRCLGDRAAVVGPSDSELADRLGGVAVDPANLESLLASKKRVFLVDDADRVDDPAGTLKRLVDGGAGPPLVVASSAERLRARFGHWSAELRTCRSGVILRPGPLDGDLLGVSLPARLDLPRIPGRGVIVSDGVARIAQVVMLGD